MNTPQYLNHYTAFKTALDYTQGYVFFKSANEMQQIIKENIHVMILTREWRSQPICGATAAGKIKLFDNKSTFIDWLDLNHFNVLKKIQIISLKIIGGRSKAKIEIMSKQIIKTNRNKWIERKWTEKIHLWIEKEQEEFKIGRIQKERSYILTDDMEVNGKYILTEPDYQFIYKIEPSLNYFDHHLFHCDQLNFLELCLNHALQPIENKKLGNSSFLHSLSIWADDYFSEIRNHSYIRLRMNNVKKIEKICSTQIIEYKIGKKILVRAIDTLYLSRIQEKIIAENALIGSDKRIFEFQTYF